MTTAKRLFNEGRINGEASIILENLGIETIQTLQEECFRVEQKEVNGKKLYIIYE